MFRALDAKFSQLFFRYKSIEKSSAVASLAVASLAVASGVASGFMLNAKNLENLENRPLLQKRIRENPE